MSALTIHAIDQALDARLGEEARKRRTSKNQLVKDLLAHSLGLEVQGAYADDYREFLGAWSVAERVEFDAGQRENRAIDKGDWV